eukprot:TRINITY_DN10474_c0_g1_i2.p1 TRINITY_DN10474_c0_g1~~TRINITY_DN10474_c0_g1_i2.p1  ORF type:complete len:366 (-),score=36.12 TRINITY_DN10474_c0_g1_i2:51-1148(-)
MTVPTFLLALLCLTSLARGTPASSCGTKTYRSQSLLQTQVRQGPTFPDLFPTYSIMDVDGTSSSAISSVLDSDPTVNKSWQHKMINPAHYVAADGSLRFVARVTHACRCACPDEPKRLCFPAEFPKHDDDSRLVSCLAGSSDGCAVVGKFADPHAFSFLGHPLAFVNSGVTDDCKPILLNLTSFESFELNLPGMGACEKNWQAIEHKGELLFSYFLAPQHRVIRCDVGSHLCQDAFNSSSSLRFDGLPSHFGSVPSVHGSTPYVELDSDHLLAAAHIHDWSYAEYWHTFYVIQREPPFAIVANTRWFQFLAPGGYEDAGWLGIQFAGGLMRNGDDVLISYGVGDCMSQATKVPVSEVANALGFHG